MPGSVGSVSGVQDRGIAGRSVASSAALQRIGRGAALAASGGNIFCNASSAGVGNGADTTEDVLFTVTLPPRTLDVVGRQILIEAYGSIAAAPSANKNARVYFGATSLTAAFAATTNQTGVWILTALVTRTGVNTQTAVVTIDHTIGANTRVPTVLSLTESDTAGITIKATGQCSVATANGVTCNMLSVGGYN
jgi:hypothetical protein